MTKNHELSDPWTTARTPKSGRRFLGKRSDSGDLKSEIPLPDASQEARQQGSQGNPEPSQSPRRFLKWPKSLLFWSGIVVLISGGLGFTATAMLLNLPSSPNCPKIFWPTASASMRLYCAQLAASKGTTKDLLEAIALVEELPQDHPLHAQINQNIEEWSQEILKLADEEFQAGNLDQAIAIAQQIPSQVQAYRLVEEKIARWRSIWSEGEDLYAQTEEQLRQSNWNQAFRVAVKLTNIPNDYWAGTKYRELVDLIQVAKEDSAKLDQAFAAVQRGGLDNLVEGIKQANKISPESYAYQEAQNLIGQAKDKLIKLGQNYLETRQWQQLLTVANNIPASLDLQEKVLDWRTLGQAGSNADLGTIAGLESAIIEAQNIRKDSPYYQKGQELITRWQLEIEDVAHLVKAEQLAQGGTIGDLTAAIAELQLIPSNHPRYEEAQKQVSQWSRQVQVLQDRPYLDRAKQLASYGTVTALQQGIQEARRIQQGRPLYQEAQAEIQKWTRQIQVIEDQPVLDQAERFARYGDIPSLQEGISQASRIQPNRALYNEAQQKVNQWSRQIQQQQDQPLLDQAQALANAGNYRAAIETARQISSGRALYGQAQTKIQTWQREVVARQRLQEAYRVAELGTPEALVSAINIAQQVPSGTQVKGESNTNADRWSYRLLTLAQDRANIDVRQAINIARRIPAGTEAYSAGQAQIQSWEMMLQPPPPVTPTIPAPQPPTATEIPVPQF